MKFTEYNEEYGRNEFGSHLNDLVTKESAVESVNLENQIAEEEAMPEGKELKCVKEYLDASLTDERNIKMKKLYATAAIIAKEKNLQPEFEKINNSASMASVVDNGLNRYKVAYQTASGQLDPVDAADALIDYAAARAVTIADKVIEKGVPLALNKLIDVIAKKYPSVEVLRPIIQATTQHVTPVVKQFVRKGIKTVADTAKSVVRKVASTVKNVATKIMNFLNA